MEEAAPAAAAQPQQKSLPPALAARLAKRGIVGQASSNPQDLGFRSRVWAHLCAVQTFHQTRPLTSSTTHGICCHDHRQACPLQNVTPLSLSARWTYPPSSMSHLSTLQAAAPTSASAAAAPAASSSGLPPGWFRATDPVYNHPYYYNPSTGERLWEPPAGSTTPPASQPAQVTP